jgi:phosphoribosylglycinamide formyltransferase-1
MRIHSPGFVKHWYNRQLNIHPSLLPLFPGLNTHARALKAGVKLHGCTVHMVRAEVDAGPILGQAAVPVLPGDDAASLAARVLQVEHRLYPACLAAFAGGEMRVVDDRIITKSTMASAQQTLINPAPES